MQKSGHSKAELSQLDNPWISMNNSLILSKNFIQMSKPSKETLSLFHIVEW